LKNGSIGVRYTVWICLGKLLLDSFVRGDHYLTLFVESFVQTEDEKEKLILYHWIERFFVGNPQSVPSNVFNMASRASLEPCVVLSQLLPFVSGVQKRSKKDVDILKKIEEKFVRAFVDDPQTRFGKCLKCFDRPSDAGVKAILQFLETTSIGRWLVKMNAGEEENVEELVEEVSGYLKRGSSSDATKKAIDKLSVGLEFCLGQMNRAEERRGKEDADGDVEMEDKRESREVLHRDTQLMTQFRENEDDEGGMGVFDNLSDDNSSAKSSGNTVSPRSDEDKMDISSSDDG